jgi:hypothetical protein
MVFGVCFVLFCFDLFVCLFICLFVCLFVYLFVCLLFTLCLLSKESDMKRVRIAMKNRLQVLGSDDYDATNLEIPPVKTYLQFIGDDNVEAPPPLAPPPKRVK